MTTACVTATGRLVYLRAVPPQIDTSRTRTEFDWRRLFEASEVDFSRFRSVPPSWVPPDAYDARGEWEGTIPELPGVPVRVAAAAYGGRPVYFEIIGPWSRPARMERITPTLTRRISGYTAGAMIAVAVCFYYLAIRREEKR